MTTGWGFTTSRPTDARYGDDVAKYAMTEGEDLKTFVREVLQNANDAGLPNDDPVEVTFRVEHLSGDDLDGFQEALDLGEWAEHAKLADGTESGERIKEYAQGVLDADRLRILTIEDRNTRGLLGDEDADETNFTALVRDVLFSSKQGDTSGGSYGLGKAVLWLFSGLSIVVFNSTLSEPDPKDESPRLIARSRLPTHKSDDGETVYQGHGWFGDTSEITGGGGERPLSVWGSEANTLAQDLHIPRPDDVPGTSIAVVGFRDPTAEEELTNDELAEDIVEEAVDSFWPAIHRGELTVTVETDDETYDASIDHHPKIHPFVDCFESRTNPKEELDEPGDVVEKTIPLEIPNKRSGEVTEDGELALCVRLADDREGYKKNSVAFVRGAGMVVEYYDRDRVVLGGQNFHGVLFGGSARPWGREGETVTPADEDVEEFLKAAEPPRHDEWRRTEALKNSYKRGYRKAVEGIRGHVTDTLRQLVSPNIERGSVGPKRLGRRFPIGNSGRSKDSNGQSQRITGSTDISFDDQHEHWVFSGELEPVSDDMQVREVTVSLARMAEERQTNDLIPVKSITSSSTGVSVSVQEDGETKVGKLSVPANVGTITFEGFSERDARQVETRLNVNAKLQRGGE